MMANCDAFFPTAGEFPRRRVSHEVARLNRTVNLARKRVIRCATHLSVQILGQHFFGTLREINWRNFLVAPFARF
jgi:hypothetical protein